MPLDIKRADKIFCSLYPVSGLLLEELRLAQAQRPLPKTLSKTKTMKKRILDDWGWDRLNTEQRRMVLDLVEERHSHHSTLITSQMPVDAWYEGHW